MNNSRQLQSSLPRLAQQPMREEELLTGALEPTNEWYAIAKIAGVKMCQAYRRQYGADFISVLPASKVVVGFFCR